MKRCLCAALVAAAICMAFDARAFSEDVYITNQSSPMPQAKNCLSQTGSSYSFCPIAPVGAARSMVHVDATYFIAQALGFRADVAYWIAAYSEVTDMGGYIPFDRCGKQFPGSNNRYVAANITGFKRDNTTAGGVGYHYVNAFSSNGDGTDLLGITGTYPYFQPGAAYPNFDDIHEGTLTHLRRWAIPTPTLLPTGPVCIDGVTTQANTSWFAGSACNSSFTITGTILIQDMLSWSFLGAPVPLGTGQNVDQLQSVLDASTGRMWLDTNVNNPNQYVAAEIAALGTYLHALQDRVSHAYCEDQSYMSQSNSTTISYTYSDSFCTDQMHAAGHYKEVGPGTVTKLTPMLKFTLPLRDYTALNITYSELLNWKAAMSVAPYNHADWFTAGAVPIDQATLVGTITSGGDAFSNLEVYTPGLVTSPLGQPNAGTRLNTMNIAIVGTMLPIMGGSSIPLTPMPGYESGNDCSPVLM